MEEDKVRIVSIRVVHTPRVCGYHWMLDLSPVGTLAVCNAVSSQQRFQSHDWAPYGQIEFVWKTQRLLQ